MRARILASAAGALLSGGSTGSEVRKICPQAPKISTAVLTATGPCLLNFGSSAVARSVEYRVEYRKGGSQGVDQ